LNKQEDSMSAAMKNKRYHQYYRRIDVALRLMAHGARAQVASDWSGMTPDQLATLRERWMPDDDGGYRGPSPKSYRPIFRSITLTSHASLFAGLHKIIGADATEPSLDGAEALCETYEAYRAWEPEGPLKFDQGVMLATGTTLDEEVGLIRCEMCGCALLVDRLQQAVQRFCKRCSN
jgi:hypothetical protein